MSIENSGFPVAFFSLFPPIPHSCYKLTFTRHSKKVSAGPLQPAFQMQQGSLPEEDDRERVEEENRDNKNVILLCLLSP